MFLDCPRQLKVVRASVKDVFLHFERSRSGKTKVGHLFSLSSKVQLDLLQTFPAYYCQFYTLSKLWRAQLGWHGKYDLGANFN